MLSKNTMHMQGIPRKVILKQEVEIIEAISNIETKE